MTKQLPWVTAQESNDNTKDIGKPSYGVVKIPFYGSLTPNEELQVAKYMFSLKDETMSEAKIDLVTILLRSRCDNSWTRDSTLAEIKSFSLVEDLYSFLISERSGWQAVSYELRVEGKGALEIASRSAQEIGGCVAKSGEAYFVFASLADVPPEYDVVEIFSVVPDSTSDSSSTAPKSAS